MLVLSRTPMQKIQIGDNVTITVLRIKGNQIKLGIEAPRDVRVVRSELPPRVLGDAPAAGAATELEPGDTDSGSNAEAEVTSETVSSVRLPGVRYATAERMQGGFAPATSPRWSGTPRTPGTAPLWSRVTTR